MQRRRFLGTATGGIIAGLSAPVWAGSAPKARGGEHPIPGHSNAQSPQAAQRSRAIEFELAAIEKGVDGRLGVAVLDLETGLRAGHRTNELFPICSTFKLLLAANVLAHADRGELDLDRRVVFTPAQLETYSPVTKHHTGQPGMTLRELCEATMTLSDNTAANLLLGETGGPAGFTAFARLLGDTVTRLDRTEPALNEAIAGDPRDTSSPLAMLDTMRKVLLGHALSRESRAQLLAWGVGNRTGDARLRAGVPDGWRVADKTGTGEHGSTNDIGALWPQDRAPVLVTVYLTQTSAPASARDAAIAEVARAVTRHVA